MNGLQWVVTCAPLCQVWASGEALWVMLGAEQGKGLTCRQSALPCGP